MLLLEVVWLSIIILPEGEEKVVFGRYFTSFSNSKLLAKGNNTGCAIYDFFMGRELNPQSLNNTFD
eukprot:2204118-Ditylum_brightwellii.AAC.1